MNEIQRAILDRRSTRGFTDEALTKEELQALVDAALASPTARNTQDWHFIFVTNRALLKRYAQAYLDIMRPINPKIGPNYDVFFNAPLCVFITLPEKYSTQFSEIDAGIAAENLVLSAWGMGMGSVILGRPHEVVDGSDGDAWKKELGFPEGHHFAIAVAIGHHNVSKEAHPVGENKVSFVE